MKNSITVKVVDIDWNTKDEDLPNDMVIDIEDDYNGGGY